MGYLATKHAVVLIAIKPLRDSKTRLSSLLDSDQRARLTLAMFTDVLESAHGAAWTRAVVVIAADPRTQDIARAYGAVVLDEPPLGGLNAAFSLADIWARTHYPSSMRVAVHGDLPSLRPMELQQAIRIADKTSRSFVADHSGMGTTALFASAGSALQPFFGPHSSFLHSLSGATPITEPLPGLRQDVDFPRDLQAAHHLGLGLATKALLAGLAVV